MLIFRLFLPCVHSNLLTANFILLRLPYFESITICFVLLIVVKSLLLFFLISLLLLTQLIIKYCLIDLLPSMVSQVLLSPYFDPIFLIALIMLLFNLPPLLPSTLLLVSLSVLSLVLSYSLSLHFSISHILENTNISFHLYADDTQLYISFSSSDSSSALASLSHTLDFVYSWLTLNRLSVNPNKTEYLLIGTQQQRSKITDSSLSFHGTALVPVSSARNLGVVFESDLSFDQHISNVCRCSFYHIRQLRQIRPSLDLNSSIQLANALVSSKLDYCNSLFYGLPDTSIKRLQRVQNSLARVIFPSLKRSDHITPALVKLHWLPVHKRIKFKIATITFKVLKNRQPSYLLDLLQPHNPQRSLRSSDKLLLDTPKIKTALATRSFSHAAPSVWNSLPFDLRNSSSLHSFTTHLKTHLFPP